MKYIILRLNSDITLSQNGSTVTNVTQGQPLTVNYSVKNFGSETWTGYVSLWIKQANGTLMCIQGENQNGLTTLNAGSSASFTFSNSGVSSPVGTTYFYVKVTNYSAGDFGEAYDVGEGLYVNPKEFQIVSGSGGDGSTTCNTCPNYDESWSINNLVGAGAWTYTSSSIGSGGCRIYRVPLISNYTYTFQTGCGNGTADFDTRLYLYDASCNQVAYNDDGCSNNLSSIEYTNTTGSNAYFYLKIDGYGNAGGSFTIAAKREGCSTPSVSISGNTSISYGSSTTLTASGASSYTWSNGSTGSSITVSPTSTTTYTVTGTNSCGGTGTASVTVTVNCFAPTLTTNNVTNISTTSATCGGNVTSDGGATVTARGVCWSTSQNPTVNNSHTTNGSGTGSFTSSITSLTPNTTYYVRAYATNSAGTSYGTQKSFTTSCNVVDVSITGTTTISYGGNTTLTASGANSYSWSTGSSNASIMVSPTATTTYTVTGTNGYGCTGTASVAVTVNYLVPTVTTSNVTNIDATSATCGGNVTATGGANVTARGVCWSTSQNPTVSGNHTTNGSGTGSFTSSITGLTPNTTYYVRAYATNSAGTSYGTQKSFTTSCNVVDVSITGTTTISYGGTTTLTASGANSYSWSTGSSNASITVSPTATTTYTVTGTNGYGCTGTASVTVTVNYNTPTVTTSNVANIAQTTATCGGNVTSDGGATVTARGVCWSTSQNPTISDSHTTNGSGTGSFTSSITGLTPNTTYYVRAYATNSMGTSYGNQVSFTTESQATDVSLFSGLVAYYPFDDDDLTDHSGNVNNGTNYSTTSTSDRFCTDGKARNFAGVDNSQYIEVPNGSTLQFTDAATVSMWFCMNGKRGMNGYGNSTETGNNHYLFAKLWDSQRNMRARVTVLDNGMFLLASEISQSCAEDTIPELQIGQWAQATFVYTTTYIETYLNGRLIAHTDASNSFSSSNGQNLRFGRMGGGWYPLNGKLDDIRVFNRALNADEVAQLYNIDIVPKDSLLVLLPLDGNVTDYSGNGFEPVIHGNLTPTTGHHGIDNTAFYFPGQADSWIEIPHDDRLSLCGSFTVSAWYNRDADCTEGNIIGKGRDIYQGWKLHTDNINVNGAASYQYHGSETSAATINSEIWYMTTGVYDSATHTLRHYLNGELVDEVYDCNVPLPTNFPVAIGRHLYSESAGNSTIWAYPFKGEIDDIVIYNRPLSTEEVQILYSYNPHVAGCSIEIPTVVTNEITNVSYSTATIGSNVTSDGGATVTARGVCWSTSQNPTVSNSHTTNGTGTGSFTSSITGLTPNTTYYVRAYATNSAGTSYGTQKTFTTSCNVVDVSIAGNTSISYGGNTTLTASGANSYSWSTGSSNASITVSPTATTTYTVTGTNGYGCTGTASVTVTVNYNKPTVTTSNVTNIAQTTATCGGNVTATGGAAVTARGVCWSTSQNPTVSGSHTTNGSGTGSFTSSITGLTPNTTYYVRAYATNSAGTSYGTQKSFTTSCNVVDVSITGTTTISYGGNTTLTASGANSYSWSTGSSNASITVSPTATTTYTVTGTNSYGCTGTASVTVTVNFIKPTVTTKSVSNITATTASCGGNVTADGGSAVTARGVCWSTSKNPTISGNHTTNGTGTGSFTSSITGLTPNTTYYVRAYATNSAGTSYGTQKTFTTSCDVVDVNIAGNTTIIYGGATTLTASGANSYSWSTGSSDASITVSPAATTTYTVTGTISNGCTGTASVTVTVNYLVPSVTTSNVTNVATTTATCGGDVTADGGAAVTARGVCWSTSHYPTISDSHTTNGSGMGTFTSTLTELESGVTYYVRAYATNSAGTDYGQEVSFKTEDVFPSCSVVIETLPFMENFDNVTTSTTAETGVEPDCWLVVTEDAALTNSTKPQVVYGVANSGDYSLRMKNRCVYAMPALGDEININRLQMTFNLRQPKAVYRLQVGVVNGNGDFEAVKTINNASSEMEPITVDFSSYEGSGHRIAFRNTVAKGSSLTYSYNYIDDIVLSKLCGIDELPYTEDFEEYTESTSLETGVQPDCWEVVTEDVPLTAATTPQLYRDFATSGSYTLRMKNRCVYAMPELVDGINVSELTMTFNLRQPKSVYRLQVGVVNENGEFEVVENINNASTEMEEVTVDFSNYTGNGHRIAFRNTVAKGSSLTYSYNYIEDININYSNACKIIALPYTERFDEYTASTSMETRVQPDCWEVVTEDVPLTDATMPQLYRDFATSGSYSLRFKNRCVYAMPELMDDINVSRLTMTFNLRQPKSVYRLQVGMVNEDGEFEVVKTINNASTEMEPITVDFSAYTGSSHRIAFRNTVPKGSTLSYSYNYIDDIVLDYAGDMLCGITLPYTENFDGFTTSTTAETGVEPTCWEVVTEDATLTAATRPQVYYGNATSGNYSLRMKNRCVYAMPEFAEEVDVSTLAMRFNLRQSNAKYRLQVGVLNTAGEFELVATLNNSSTEMEEVTVDFSDYNGNGNRIAFRNTVSKGSTLTYSYNYLDDINIFSSTTKMNVVDVNTDNAVAMPVDRYLESITVYPNPTTGMLHIDAVDVQKVECYSQMGQLVGVYENVNELNIGNLAKGVYTLRITVPQGVTMRKVVKR